MDFRLLHSIDSLFLLGIVFGIGLTYYLFRILKGNLWYKILIFIRITVLISLFFLLSDPLLIINSKTDKNLSWAIFVDNSASIKNHKTPSINSIKSGLKDLLDKLVDLTDRYVKNKFFPDKALDIVDAAGAKAKLAGKGTVELNDVIKVLAKVSKVSVDMIDVEKKDGYRKLDAKMKETVYGQDEAIDKVVENILVAKAGLREKNKPIGSYLFVGPTGTGKTETARALSSSMDAKLIKFDMSEYQERHSVSKLIGAPPGYVGHAEGKMGQGQLLTSVEEHPNCVLLLDEVEKAAPEVLQILLQVMDDGKLTGATGKATDFSNVVLLMTSNLGAAASETKKIGFGDNVKKGEMNKAVEKFFTPEFRNRLDAVVEFNTLSKDLMYKIVDKLVGDTNELLQENESGVVISLDESARQQLAEDGYQPSMGARPLKRVFENSIKKPLSRKILFDNLTNTVINVAYTGDTYEFNIATE